MVNDLFPSATLLSIRASENDSILYIPVVVHVVYRTAMQNISDEQIFSQINVLNEDFNRKNADSILTLPVFRPVAANCKIVFFLARNDDTGSTTSGITRTITSHGPFADDDLHFSNRGGKDAWNTKRFLNVWVADMTDRVFGYGNPPGTSPATDGVVVDFQYFGTTGTVTTPFNKGRTATHEVGHWLGLKHPWGNAGGCSDDDGIIDTPSQFGPSTGCNLNRVSCGALNMVQNFMDESDDACMNIFTKGQKKVMRNSLFLLRPEAYQTALITSLNSEAAEAIKLSYIGNNCYQINSSQYAVMYVCDVTGRQLDFSEENFSNFKRVRIQEIGTNVKIFTLKGNRSVIRIKTF
ncbi:MAG: zinc metalloprotease [Cyclobacteriaceae bacterium]|nr:zinc metalloprotease [Cyclobacteriaceae bacterium]